MNCAVHTQTQAAAYCRTCGKALCEDCKRDVVGAIYCEPCIAARLQSSVAPGGRTMPPPPPSAPGAPNPGLAGFLGLIPGVGAMYNGQFAKALVHVVIFILLIFGLNANLPDGVEVVFALFTAFFVLYMAFEAFKTAQAKQFGLPAPDPLGLDKMFGLQDSQATASVNADVTVGGPVQVPPPLAAPGRQDNVPVAAIVLLILGGVFLLSNFHLMHIGRLLPLLPIGLGLWIAFKRTSLDAGRVCPCARCQARGLMGAAILITLGVLGLMHSFNVVHFGQSFPVLLLVIGAVLLVARTGSTENHIARHWIPNAVPPPPPPAEQSEPQVKL